MVILSQTTMKSISALLSLACLVSASPILPSYDGQIALGGLGEYHTNYPGFSIDLSAQRLVQFEGKEPIWVSELEKVMCIVNCTAIPG